MEKVQNVGTKSAFTPSVYGQVGRPGVSDASIVLEPNQ